MRTRAKICGIKELEHALIAADEGADAIGLVFYSKSPRCVELDLAEKIVESLPPFIAVVGLFMDADVAAVNHVLNHVRLDVLQFHGQESPAYCEAFARPYIKAIGAKNNPDIAVQAATYSSAKAILLDSHEFGAAGGTGESCDWNAIPRELPKPLVLAGGLNPENVTDAIRQVRPFAVDVSSGVERSRGEKDATLIREFLRGVMRAESK